MRHCERHQNAWKPQLPGANFVAALFCIPLANGVAAPHNSNHNNGTGSQAKFVTDARHS
jgi:hypothetical protein